MVEELGLGIDGLDELLSEWDDKPLGTASIGQVFKAKLRSTGEWVAVKVQMPGVERMFRADIRCLQLFTFVAVPWAYAQLVDIERAFEAEFNFVEEARNLEECRACLLPTWSHKVLSSAASISCGGVTQSTLCLAKNVSCVCVDHSLLCLVSFSYPNLTRTCRKVYVPRPIPELTSRRVLGVPFVSQGISS